MIYRARTGIHNLFLFFFLHRALQSQGPSHEQGLHTDCYAQPVHQNMHVIVCYIRDSWIQTRGLLVVCRNPVLLTRLEPLGDPCLQINVSASLSSDFVALRRRNANFDLRRRVLCGPAQGKQSGRDPRERFAQAKRKF